MGWECVENIDNIKPLKSNLIRQFIIGNYTTKLTKKTFLRRSASDSQILSKNLFVSYEKLFNFNEKKNCEILSEKEV